jgi:hypothetical protein
MLINSSLYLLRRQLIITRLQRKREPERYQGEQLLRTLV